MTDEATAVEAEGVVTPDENASPEPESTLTEPEGQTAETEAKESEADSSPAPKDPGDGAETDKFQKRVNKLTWQREEEKRLRQAAERERDHLRTLVKAKPPEPMKSRADFDHDEDRWQAYVAERASTTAVHSAREELARDAQQAEANRLQAAFEAREAEFAVENKDYYQIRNVVGQSLSPEIAQAIKGSDEGPALVQYLGNNPATLSAIAQLSPISAARELGRIESRLVAAKEAPKPAPVSKAPPPAAKIAPTDPGAEKDPSKMTDAEFAKWRKKQIAQRG